MDSIGFKAISFDKSLCKEPVKASDGKISVLVVEPNKYPKNRAVNRLLEEYGWGLSLIHIFTKPHCAAHNHDTGNFAMQFRVAIEQQGNVSLRSGRNNGDRCV